MEHRGEIIKKAVYQSGYPITRLAADMKKSRSWLYKLFESPNASFHVIKEIGLHINYDFSSDFKELKLPQTASPETSLKNLKNNVYNQEHTKEYWIHKYLILLEDYTNLLKKVHHK